MRPYNSKFKGNGLTGLTNCGNTCYLNTCLQILSHTYELNEILDNNKFRKFLKKTPDGVMLYEWEELRHLMWSDDCIVKPSRFLKIVQSVAAHKKQDIFTGWEQNDMSEFYLFILECFHEGLSREVNMTIRGRCDSEKDNLAKKCYERMIQLYEKSYSELLDLFFGIQVWSVSIIKDNTSVPAGITEMTPDPFMSLDLSISPNTLTIGLVDCINKNLEPDRIDGFVDVDGNQKERQLKFWTLPKVLMINIKRYDAYGRKVRTAIIPELEIDFKPHVIGYQQDTNYEIYAAAIHTGGSTQGGHYYAIIRTNDNEWHMFNDTQVSRVDPSRITNLTQGASCFFYRKK